MGRIWRSIFDILYSRAIIVYSILLHYIWAFSVMIDPTVNGVTGLYLFQTVFHPPFARVVLIIVATLSIFGLYTKDVRLAATLMVPQQFTMMISAGGVVLAVASGSYSDGVLHPRMFIFADQSPLITAALLHTVAIWGVVRRAHWTGPQ